jgi:16S rRNA processing protein RimM
MKRQAKPRPTPDPTQRERRTTEVRLGRIVGGFGIRGELKIVPTRSGADTLRPGLVVSVVAVEGTREGRIETVRSHKRHLLVRFAGIDEHASGRLIGADVFAARELVPLREGEYFDDDLVGCAIVDPGGMELGRVVDVVHYPAQDMLVVGRRRALIPLVGAFIRRIDIGRKRIDVDLPEGLFD